MKKAIKYFGINYVKLNLKFIIPFVFFNGISLLCRLIFDFTTIETNICFVIITSILVFFTYFSFSKKIFFYKIDVLFFLIISYVIFHFCFFSQYNIFNYKFLLFLSYFFCFFIFRKILHEISTKQLNSCLLTFILFALVQCMFALCQYFNFIIAKSNYFKLLGAFTSPNSLGIYVCIGLIFLLYLVFERNYKLNYIFFSITFIVFITTIILSNSRTSWVAFLFAIIYLFSALRKKIKFNFSITFSLVLICMILLFYSVKFLYYMKPDSVNGRFFAAKITIDKICESPIIGHGLFSFDGKYNQHKSEYFQKEERSWPEKKIATYIFTPFNDFLLVTFELGLIFSILIFWFFFILMVKSKINRKTRLGNSLLVFLFFTALFSSPLAIPEIIIIGIFAVELIISKGNFKRIKFFKSNFVDYFALSGVLFVLIIANIKFFYAREVKNINSTKIPYDTLIFYNEDNFYNILFLGNYFVRVENSQDIDLIELVFNKNLTPKLGQIIAFENEKRGNIEKVERILEYNLFCEPYRYYPKIQLLSFYERQHKTKKVISLAKEIVNLPIKIPSKKVFEYKRVALQKLKTYSFD